MRSPCRSTIVLQIPKGDADEVGFHQMPDSGFLFQQLPLPFGYLIRRDFELLRYLISVLSPRSAANAALALPPEWLRLVSEFVRHFPGLNLAPLHHLRRRYCAIRL
jgi:hypothetical protein